MMDTRLTRRGKIVFGAFIAALSIATYWMFMDIITPADCKVAFDQMSEACQVLVFEK